MDQENQQSLALRDKLAPPGHSDVSAMLNGIGNGVMVVGVPLMLLKLFHNAKSTAISKKLLHFLEAPKMVAFGMVGGSAIGAWFGWEEAKGIKQYRQHFAEEVVKLREQTDANSAAIRQWSQKMREEKPAHAADPVALSR